MPLFSNGLITVLSKAPRYVILRKRENITVVHLLLLLRRYEPLLLSSTISIGARPMGKGKAKEMEATQGSIIPA